MKYAELRFYNRSTGRFVAIKMDTTSLKEGTLKYYENDDVLYFFLKKGIETRSVEAAPGITIELNNKNQIIGIEILDASKFIQEYIIKTFSRDLDLVDNL